MGLGVTAAYRIRIETLGVIGFFVNTQVLSLEVQGRESFEEISRQARERVLEAQANAELPFEQLVETLRPERSLSHNPLFQVMYNHQRGGELKGFERLGEVEIEPLEPVGVTTQFDLSLDVVEQGELLECAFTYAADLFDATTIERLARHWVQLRGQLVESP